MESMIEWSDLSTKASILKNRIEIIEERLEMIIPIEQSNLTHKKIYNYFFIEDWTSFTKGQDMPALALKIHLNYNELMRKNPFSSWSGENSHKHFYKVGIGEEPFTFWVHREEKRILYITTIPSEFYSQYFTLLQLKTELSNINKEIEERLRAIQGDKTSPILEVKPKIYLFERESNPLHWYWYFLIIYCICLIVFLLTMGEII